jgi:hypothetical protein
MMNYVEYLRIRLFGVQIISLVKSLLIVVVGLFGIRIKLVDIMQIVNWRGLLFQQR